MPNTLKERIAEPCDGQDESPALRDFQEWVLGDRYQSPFMNWAFLLGQANLVSKAVERSTAYTPKRRDVITDDRIGCGGGRRDRFPAVRECFDPSKLLVHHNPQPAKYIAFERNAGRSLKPLG